MTKEAPVVKVHQGIHVVRDDLFLGGTKARFIPALFDDCEELVYASPAEGGAQTAIATVARRLGRRATIFVAKRATPHPRTVMAHRLGAKVLMVSPGYLAVVEARAREYVDRASGSVRLAPFGLDLPIAESAISQAASLISVDPKEVWCAAGSGTLARALAVAFPDAERHVVQVGRELSSSDVAGARIHVHPLKFGDRGNMTPPFPSDLHYDSKAWELCLARCGDGKVLFWNVTGPPA